MQHPLTVFEWLQSTRGSNSREMFTTVDDPMPNEVHPRNLHLPMIDLVLSHYASKVKCAWRVDLKNWKLISTW